MNYLIRSQAICILNCSAGLHNGLMGAATSRFVDLKPTPPTACGRLAPSPHCHTWRHIFYNCVTMFVNSLNGFQQLYLEILDKSLLSTKFLEY